MYLSGDGEPQRALRAAENGEDARLHADATNGSLVSESPPRYNVFKRKNE